MQDAAAARRFFEKAMRHNTVPDKVTMDKSGANQAALEQLNKEREVPITIRQIKYLNVTVQPRL
jgi:putative transposase